MAGTTSVSVDLDALLADLQTSIPQHNSTAPAHSPTPHNAQRPSNQHNGGGGGGGSDHQHNERDVMQHQQQKQHFEPQYTNGDVDPQREEQPSKKVYYQESKEETRTETRSSGPNPSGVLMNQATTPRNNELDSLLSELNTSSSYVKDSHNTQQSSVARPSVDSLLNELNSVSSHQQSTHVNHQNHVNHSTGQPSITTSTATRDLDDLMAELSDFKLNRNDTYAKPEKPKSPSPPQPIIHIQQQQQAPPPPQQPPPKEPTPPVADELDCMLGSLATHMTEQGVTTTQKGACCACDKPIVGQVITALGKTWHPEHFTCAHCTHELGSKNFFERDGRPYCESCYHELFSPRCAYCDGSILDKCVTALDKNWHPEHFFCAQCGNTFGEEGFHEKDGKAYCREDYYSMFAPKCGGCNSPIMENYISALNTQWHPECFVCRDCRQPFNGGSFFDHEGMPYCETHYHAKRGSLCAGCHKPITGRCITAMFRKYHPEHFTCSFCLRQLNKGTFKEQNEKPYCHGCFDKLFS